MTFYALTQKGTNKKENEDRILIGKSVIKAQQYHTELDYGFIAVADGVGGNDGGAIASEFVVRELSQYNYCNETVMAEINRRLIMKARKQPMYSAMANTLSGIFLEKEGFLVFNTGNSRVYALQCGKYLKQLTQDDTTLNFLLNTGKLSQESAETFERKNEITACFGGGNENLFKVAIQKFDAYFSVMLTTDGIHDYLSEDDIEEILDIYGISFNACQKITQKARENGSCDDISIILGNLTET